jgi:hypothetical protein
MTSPMKKTKQCWSDMKQRCFNQKAKQYPNYGGRGITVCDEWVSSFKQFISDMGEKPEGKTLDRINNNDNYAPSNCRWATKTEQQSNRRNVNIIEFEGKKMTMREWAKYLGRHEATLSFRLKRGYPIELLLSSQILRFGNTSAPAAMEKKP